MIDTDAIIAQYRAGTLSPADAAAALLPLLKAAGKLELPLSENDLSLLQALQRLTQPPLPAAQPLEWDSRVWQGLERMPAILWPQITRSRLDQIPQCFNYVFLVGSEVAAEALAAQIQAGSDHSVTAQLPESYETHCGRLFGQTPPRLITEADLVAWGKWLQSLTPVAQATLEKIHLSPPPQRDES